MRQSEGGTERAARGVSLPAALEARRGAAQPHRAPLEQPPATRRRRASISFIPARRLPLPAPRPRSLDAVRGASPRPRAAQLASSARRHHWRASEAPVPSAAARADIVRDFEEAWWPALEHRRLGLPSWHRVRARPRRSPRRRRRRHCECSACPRLRTGLARRSRVGPHRRRRCPTPRPDAARGDRRRPAPVLVAHQPRRRHRHGASPSTWSSERITQHLGGLETRISPARDLRADPRATSRAAPGRPRPAAGRRRPRSRCR